MDNVIVYKSRIGRYPFMMTPGMNGHINCHNYFYGPSYREAHKLLNASFIPVDLPNYYRMVISPAISLLRRSLPWTSMAICTLA